MRYFLRFFILIVIITFVPAVSSAQWYKEISHEDLLGLAESGAVNAQYHLGMNYFEKGQIKKALKWLKKASESTEIGDCEDALLSEYATQALLDYYFKAGDYDSAIKCCKRYLGKGGDHYKESDVYLMLATYIYPDKRYLDYLQKSVKMGNADAIAALACVYAIGRDVRRDDKKAIELYRKYLKKKGENRNGVNLGDVYYYIYHYSDYLQFENRIINVLSKGDSEKWLLKAARQGHKKAQEELKDMGKKW